MFAELAPAPVAIAFRLSIDCLSNRLPKCHTLQSMTKRPPGSERGNAMSKHWRDTLRRVPNT